MVRPVFSPGSWPGSKSGVSRTSLKVSGGGGCFPPVTVASGVLAGGAAPAPAARGAGGCAPCWAGGAAGAACVTGVACGRGRVRLFTSAANGGACPAAWTGIGPRDGRGGVGAVAGAEGNAWAGGDACPRASSSNSFERRVTDACSLVTSSKRCALSFWRPMGNASSWFAVSSSTSATSLRLAASILESNSCRSGCGGPPAGAEERCLASKSNSC